MDPGSFCGRDGTVVPRQGDAMEPVLLGWLIGPDAEVRTHLPLAEAPAHLIAALTTAEDDRFYDHMGVDLIGTARAALVNLRGGGVRQGASTLTMQVVRGIVQHSERTYARKLREMASAVAVDRAMGKDGILQIYLDLPYLGQDGSLSICGFEAAARYYWGIGAAELSVAQAATLASILPGPARWAPDRFPELAQARRDALLRRMAEKGWDVDAALAEPMGASPHPVLPPERDLAYLGAVRTELLGRLPPEVVYGAGLEVHTAMDLVAQEDGLALLSERVAFLERTVGRRGPGPLRAAGVVLDPATGALVAVADTGMERSTDFSRAVDARRQPGSSFKPVVYALGLSARDATGAPRFTTASTFPNTPRAFAEGWVPRNVGGHYTPTATIADGLASSHNVVSVSLLMEAGGPDALVELAARLGFDTTAFPHEPGLALGQAEVSVLEMARFAGLIDASGRAVSGSALRSVRDAAGRERLPAAALGDAILEPETAQLVRELMGLVVSQGTGGGLRGRAGFPGYDGPAFGKTGTSDDEKDLWFVGGTGQLVAAMWLGYDEPTRVGAAASDFAAPLWGWWMNAVHTGWARAPLAPVDLDHAWVCSQTGRLAGPGCRGLQAPFRKGTAPHVACDGAHGPEAWTLLDHVSLWDKIAEGVPSDEPVVAPVADPTE